MAQTLSLRWIVPESFRLALRAVRGAPLGAGLIALALAAPGLIGEGPVGLATALLVLLVQLAALTVGGTGLTRAALGRTSRLGVRLGGDEARFLASHLLCGLFLLLVILILGLVLIAVAGATGFGPGEDFTITTQAAAQGGWRMWVLLALEIAGVMILLTAWARLLPAGPATVASGRVVSLAVVKWTRGGGLKPMAGLILMLAPMALLVVWGLTVAPERPWVDVAWAVVLGGVQAPLLIGYGTALFRAAAPQGEF